jgi:branched-chain amino acid transport system ATP-binding protein
MSASYLDVSGVSKHFGGLKALDDCSFTVPKGQITCLIGPNGAGKTSIFNAITGFIRTDSGSIAFKDQPLTNRRPRWIAHQGICRSFQGLRLFTELSVLDNVSLYLPNHTDENPFRPILRPWRSAADRKARKAKAMAVLEQVGLAAKADALAQNLSYGQQKLVTIARLLASGAELLLLDEPASGLNPKALAGMVELINRLKATGITFLVVEHNMTVVRQLADRVAFLHEGHVLAEGDPATIIADPALAEIYFGGVA